MLRRDLLKLAALSAGASALRMPATALPLPAQDSGRMPIIDAHIHLFDTLRPGGVPWPEKTDTILYKPALPERYVNESGALGIVGAIAIEASPLAMCVPVIGGGKPFALIYMERNHTERRPFDKVELELAVGISHQTGLAMQRIELLEKIRKEGQVKQLLLRFVSPIEAEDGLKDYLKTGNLPALAEKTVTVLFAEIADSSGLMERIGPQKFSTYLNTFYQFATQMVFKNSGVAKYLGDGLLAVFMEAKDKPGHEERAAMVACEIVDFIKRSDPPESDRPAVVGVALNTGKAMVGYVGAQERAEFNVLGNLIKITYRMQEYALPNRIFVGAATAQAIHTKYLLEKAGSLSMKGSEKSIQAYALSFMKTAPFVPPDKNSDMPAAFKAIAEKLKTLGK